MKPLPKHPQAFGDRVIAALCADIADRNQYRRVDAIREIIVQMRSQGQ